MSDALYEALEACLLAIEKGASLNQALSKYPEIRDELQPLLEMAIQSKQLQVDDIPTDVMIRSRTQALNHAAKLRSAHRKPIGILKSLPRFATAVLLVLILILTSSSIMSASAKSLPGDQLYPVKRAVENVRLGITLDSTTHQDIEASFQERRLSEVQQLINLQRSERVSFDAQVILQGDDRWVIGDVVVLLTPETIIIGEITPGMVVEVEGITRPNGWVQASEIHLRNFKITGVVESISPNLWHISGEEIQINSDTYIDPNIQVGQIVVVQIHSTDDGVFYARNILLESLLPTMTPHPILRPTEELESLDDQTEDEGTETIETGDESEDGDDLFDETDEPVEPDESEEPDDPDETEEPDEPDETDEPDEIDEPNETDEPDDPEETDEPDE